MVSEVKHVQTNSSIDGGWTSFLNVLDSKLLLFQIFFAQSNLFSSSHIYVFDCIELWGVENCPKHRQNFQKTQHVKTTVTVKTLSLPSHSGWQGQHAEISELFGQSSKHGRAKFVEPLANYDLIETAWGPALEPNWAAKFPGKNYAILHDWKNIDAMLSWGLHFSSGTSVWVPMLVTNRVLYTQVSSTLRISIAFLPGCLESHCALTSTWDEVGDRK